MKNAKKPTTNKVNFVEEIFDSSIIKLEKNFITSNSETEIAAAIPDKTINTQRNLPLGKMALNPATVSLIINFIFKPLTFRNLRSRLNDLLSQKVLNRFRKLSRRNYLEK